MQSYDLTIKKRPKQARAQATFDAIIEAATKLLIEQGYAATTTNHIADRAGVAISSLYQYFATKDGVIAEVISQLVQRVMEQAANALPNINLIKENRTKYFIETIYQILEKEKDLIRVLAYEVPYAKEIEEVEKVPELVNQVAKATLGFSPSNNMDNSQGAKTSLYITIIFICSSLLLLVLHPPEKVSVEEMIDELVKRLELWEKYS